MRALARTAATPRVRLYDIYIQYTVVQYTRVQYCTVLIVIMLFITVFIQYK